jgi:hypothetical protein
MAASLELFHEVAHAPSARVRRLAVERKVTAHLRFRNISYPKVAAEFQARGGHTLPALWDGVTLWQGEAAVTEKLSALAPSAP